ncbi:hypothetical protein AB0L40_16920, partial [Patulibacter sp. NPDC049589]|uniref:hypothetical protein n=1 Tax=Patulibacter sp. NPDC049589 TaxID=3154731 RepID=UPI00343D1B08
TAPPCGAGRRRVAGVAGWLATVALLVAGGAAVASTLDRAVDDARDDPRVVEHALASNPFGPRSMLREAATRRGLARVRAAADAGDRFDGVVVTPERLQVTLVDAREQARWVAVGPTGRISETDLGTRSGPAAPLSELRDVDPGPAARLVARKYRALRPDATDPTLVLSVGSVSTTSTSVRDLAAALAGQSPRTTTSSSSSTRWVLRWTASFRGVRSADATWPLEPR